MLMAGSALAISANINQRTAERSSGVSAGSRDRERHQFAKNGSLRSSPAFGHAFNLRQSSSLLAPWSGAPFAQIAGGRALRHASNLNPVSRNSSAAMDIIEWKYWFDAPRL